MSEITLVTGLFDIGRGDLESGMFARSFDRYKEWFKDVLTIDLPMVVYVENLEMEEWVYDNRPGAVVNLLSLDTFKNTFYNKKVQKIRTNPEWYNQNHWLRYAPQAALELYNPLVMYKMYLLNECAEKNIFNTPKYLWIDAGITNIIPINLFDNFEEKINPWLDKLLFLCFPYRGKEAHGFKTEALDAFAGTRVDRVARATLWGGLRNLIREITPKYTTLLNDTLSQGYMGTEENILTLLTYLVPDMCNIYMLENDRLTSFFEKLSKG
jgi:hypothetical protein